MKLSTTITDKEAWDEDIKETVTDREAWDQDVYGTIVDREAWDEHLSVEGHFSDRQTSICRELNNYGHLHGDLNLRMM